MVVIAGLAAAQTDDSVFEPVIPAPGVTFMPGLGENATVWNGMSSTLLQTYSYNESFQDYNDAVAISAAADALYIPPGEVILAHSQGGLVAREYIRDHGAGYFNALITVGTPHTGAPIISNVLNGNVVSVLFTWIRDLYLGPWIAYRSGEPLYVDLLAHFTAKGVIGSGMDALQGYIHTTYGGNTSVTDMIPGSNFLTTLNSKPDNTLPAARYAIFGAEQFHTPWHLLGSLASGPGKVEDKAGIIVHNVLESIYGAATAYASFQKAAYYYRMRRAKANWEILDYLKYKEEYFKWSRIAAAYRVGYDSLHYKQQLQWSKYVTGSLVGNTWYAEDGILPAFTKAPAFFDTPDNINRRLPARKVNHIEETAHPNVKERLSQIFQNYDVDIPDGTIDDPPPPPGPAPLSVNITGFSHAKDGQTLLFSANVSNAEGSVSYQWSYRKEGWSGFVLDGSNSSSYSHTFHTTYGENTHTSIRIEIHNSGETAIDILKVAVQGCEDGLSGGGGGIGTNTIALPPCD
ncbi:MAG TPA: hypothetical protein VK106_04755 [Balneolaceae bacterium]|nr:hypothetical protein [Balneolaceae bacterium]